MMNFSMRGSVQLGRVDGRERVAKPISREVSFRRDDPLPVGSTVLRTSPVVVRIAALAERQPGLRAARVAQMSVEVLVIDGRPRYHLPGCVHLLGRQHEPLPVSEAVELGFTPCGLCEPDSALLAEARRV